MEHLTLQRVATEACRGEGGKEEVNIAQACDLLKAAFEFLAKERPSQVLALVESFKNDS